MPQLDTAPILWPFLAANSAAAARAAIGAAAQSDLASTSSSLAAQVTRQATDLKDRDRQYGVNTWRQNRLISALADLKDRSLQADTTVSRPATDTTAGQSGTTVTIGAGTDRFYFADIGRKIVFADGSFCVIRDVIPPAGYDVNPSLPIKEVRADRSATVSAQAWRIQPKGACFTNPGDSTGYSCLTDLRNMLYRAGGLGGMMLSAASDTTIGDYASTVISAGVVKLANAFDCAFAGLAWQMALNETVEGYINPKYKAAVNDEQQVFDIPQEERWSDAVTIFWKRKAAAGTVFQVEYRLHEAFDWATLPGAGSIDASTGTEYLGVFHVGHAAGVCWHYRVTVTADSLGDGMILTGIYTEKKSAPGVTFIEQDTGGSKVTNYLLINTQALSQYNRHLGFDQVHYQFRDYALVDGAGAGQVPDLPAVLPQYVQKYTDAGCLVNWVFTGGYQNDDNTAHAENEAYRDFCTVESGHIYIDQRALWLNYLECYSAGGMVDGVHGGGSRFGRMAGTHIAGELGILDFPWTNDPRDINAGRAEINELTVRGQNIALALEAAKQGPWGNGVKNLSASGYAAWASGLPAPGTAGFTAQIWIDVPATNPPASIPLFGIHPAQSTSNAARMVTCIINTSGQFSIAFRNLANDGSATYRLTDFIQKYGGRRGCLTVQINPAVDHPLVWFDTESVNQQCLPQYSPTASVTIQKITEPFDAAGTWFNLGITTTHFARQCAYWAGSVPSWENELKRNAQRGTVSGTPTALWVTGLGAGRLIPDISGNGKHVQLGGSSPSTLNNAGHGSTVGYVWLNPTNVRTAYRMTANAGMTPLPGETILADMATLATITLPATGNPAAPPFEITGMNTGMWRLAQPASTQIVSGPGASEGVDATTAGTSGYVQSTQKYSSISVRALTASLWHTPAFPAAATIAVSTATAVAPEAANVTGARMAGLLNGGIQSFGAPYAPWSVIPALGTAGFTLAWTGLVPASAPGSVIIIGRTSGNRAVSNNGGSLEVGFNSSGRLYITHRTADNLSSRSWQLNNFFTGYAGRLVRLTVRFNPAAADPEVWVEDAKISGTGGFTWAVQDVGAPPTIATANFSGTNCMVGADSPCYQFALWAGVLADAQIAENQRNGAAVGAAAPLVYYTFQEGGGRTSRHLSGNGRDAVFLNSGGSNANDSGNGITTGVRWLRRRRQSAYAVTANSALTLRPGERTITNAPVTRVNCTLEPVVELDGGDITLENIGAAGFLLTLPTGHKAVMGAGVTVGTDATSSAGTITSNQLYAAVVLRPLIVNSATDVTWRLVTASGVTLA